ncbi:MAG: TolC family protein [Chitinophagaceae bacterium]|nr:TolC family protein [Chitinophagaceae bacterium]
MKKITISLLLSLGSFCVTAQDTSNLPKQWTLQECIDYAIQHNISINTLKLNSSSAQLDVSQSKYNQLPSVGGSIAQNLGNNNSVSFTSNYGVSSTLTLYNGGYLKNDIKAKELSLESANLSVEEASNDITLNITQSFLNILLVKENITNLEQIRSTSEEQLKQAQQLYDAGSIARKELVQFQSQLASDEYNLVSAHNNYRSNVVALKQILQLPASDNFEILAPTSIAIQEAVLTLDNTLSAAQNSRPEIKNKNVAIQLAQVNLEKIKASRMPVISLGAGLSSGYSSIQSSKYLPQLGNNFSQTLGVSMSIPIFSRNQNKTNITKSTIAIEQAKLDLSNAATSLNQQVEQVYINLLNAQAQYKAADTRLKVAKESYDITNEQLRLGSVIAIDVLIQRNTYTQALQSYIQAKYTAILYNKIYGFYSGQPIVF